MAHNTYEWKVKDDVTDDDMADCMRMWMHMYGAKSKSDLYEQMYGSTFKRGNRAGFHPPRHEGFGQVKGYGVYGSAPEIELSEEDKKWVSLFPKWKDVPGETIMDVGAPFPARIARRHLTVEQDNRLTRGLCDALFRPRRKEFV